MFFFVARKFRIKSFFLRPIYNKYRAFSEIKTPISLSRSGLNNLNLQYSFEDCLNGQISHKLYLYNIFYMNDYNDERYIFFHSQQYKTKSVFLEPYPTSLRIVNLLYYSNLKNEEVIRYLAMDAKNLSLNLEIELDGNHLLENYLALSLFELIAGINDKYTKKFARQLKIQFIDCEWHFEQSPMYQAIILERLQCYLSLVDAMGSDIPIIRGLCSEILTKGVAYLELFYVHGFMLHFNDSTGGNSLSIKELKRNNKLLKLSPCSQIENKALIKNGFARIDIARYILVVDSSKILANHIPGHMHSAMGTFSLFRNRKPFILNNAISTYQEDDIRKYQRSSSFHNCIVPKIEFNEVWGNFRVARRIKCTLDQDENSLTLSAKLLTNKLYTRTFHYDNLLKISDSVEDCDEEMLSFLYFHSDVTPKLIVDAVWSTNIYCIESIETPLEYYKFARAYRIYFKFRKNNVVWIN